MDKSKSIRLKSFPGWPQNKTWQSKSYDQSINWPKLSIVTPSFNQASFLEQTILSVLNQGYPNLEYIIIDGGSTDRSVDIIKKYEKYLAYWEAKEDQGQSHALNKGVSHASGEWIAWINSDDYYLPNAFYYVIRKAFEEKYANWIVGNTLLQRSIFLSLVSSHYFRPRSGNGSMGGGDYQKGTWLDYVCNDWSGIALPQPSSFWRRAIWKQVGGLDESLHYSMDTEFYGRLAYLGYRPVILNSDLAIFTIHKFQKSNIRKLFHNDAIRIFDKWLDQEISIEEKSILTEYRNYFIHNYHN